MDEEQYEGNDIDPEIEETFKTESKRMLHEIINKKITVENIREETDNMLIACITELDMTYEDAFTTLSKKFNMPLIEIS